MNIFISHSSKDAESANEVCALLEQAGHTCFIAPRDIPSGKEYAQEIMLGIERSQAVLFMLSANSNSSPHVLREIEHAVSRSIPIVVYKMEEVELTKSMEYFLMAHQWMNQKANEGYDAIVKCMDNLQSDFDQSAALRDVGRNNAPLPKGSTAQGKTAGNGKKDRMVKALAAVVLTAVVLAAILIPLAGSRRKDSQHTGARPALALGDTVTLGTYNNEPIAWRVVRLSEDEGTAVLIAEHIITMKAYDAAASDRYNIDNGNDYWRYSSDDFQDKTLETRVRGNNDWASSNIRTWLNADTQIVDYEGNAPSALAMSELKNGYENEAGFLYGFTAAERDAIVETQVECKGNALSQDSCPATSDKVFLLSLEELDWLEEADVSIYTTPTEAAVSQDGTGWYDSYSLSYGITSYFWWLREPAENSPSQCYIVCNGLTDARTKTETVGVEGFGIRPAITVELRALEGLNTEAKVGENL